MSRPERARLIPILPRHARAVILILALCAILGPPAPNQFVLVPELESDGHLVPPGYYAMVCVIPPGIDVEFWLEQYKYMEPYEAYAWDCSQMSAYNEWVLENCGYEAQIVLGFGHAWVRVKIDGEWLLYEATSRRFVTSEMRQKYLGYDRPFRIFDDIYGLRDFYFYEQWVDVNYIQEIYRQEWAWWERDE